MTKKNTPKAIDQKDVDDVIGLATDIDEKQQRELGKVSLDEMVNIGEQVGLDRDDVEQAVGKLESHKKEQARQVAERLRRRKIALMVCLGTAALFLLICFVGRSGLKSAASTAAQKRSQVASVVERRNQTKANFAGKASTPGIVAEIAGAENRIGIEKRRYDQAATTYNKKADSFPGSWGRRLFFMDKKLPLASEIKEW